MFAIIDWIRNIPVHMDYKGQQFAEKVFNGILILFGICGFCWGYYKQQFHLTVLILLAGFLLSCIIVLPPWPFYRRDPLQWQKPRDTAEKSEAKKDARKKPKAN
ncbi:signal peptidase complex subunit 1 [Paramuricea clavata]|uniref:Signal peptidase complex subunit 1 n=1 Tax=Paramuricea clavata TaxID=317549 RepID=A0A7D9EK18_PARCT|nr:signal peptidase complex subunit 1 [Paramuricea clavata]